MASIGMMEGVLAPDVAVSTGGDNANGGGGNGGIGSQLSPSARAQNFRSNLDCGNNAGPTTFDPRGGGFGLFPPQPSSLMIQMQPQPHPQPPLGFGGGFPGLDGGLCGMGRPEFQTNAGGGLDLDTMTRNNALFNGVQNQQGGMAGMVPPQALPELNHHLPLDGANGSPTGLVDAIKFENNFANFNNNLNGLADMGGRIQTQQLQGQNGFFGANPVALGGTMNGLNGLNSPSVADNVGLRDAPPPSSNLGGLFQPGQVAVVPGGAGLPLG
eukprot:CAMPEP_0197440320 /NCGR_PEP_ID=MMETSP1175-20131217/6854_1 /TAXON_ID=1003142 /ORGANISM="Triceratium dubium, Strain CCMP147" /LENGTH=269 /DNA_ID=CAMNT_0042970397 /DNA_START=35 /DNA_END=840 /DNA_ORIENTATION=+